MAQSLGCCHRPAGKAERLAQLSTRPIWSRGRGTALHSTPAVGGGRGQALKRRSDIPAGGISLNQNPGLLLLHLPGQGSLQQGLSLGKTRPGRDGKGGSRRGRAAWGEPQSPAVPPGFAGYPWERSGQPAPLLAQRDRGVPRQLSPCSGMLLLRAHGCHLLMLTCPQGAGTAGKSFLKPSTPLPPPLSTHQTSCLPLALAKSALRAFLAEGCPWVPK